MEASNPGATPPERILADGHAFEAFDWRIITEGEADWVMEMEITPRVVNSLGALQGGLLATLIDSVGGMALLQGDLAGPRHVTSELQISFLAAARVGPVRAVAHILHRGRKSAVVRVDVRDVGADDLFVATGTLRFALMSGEAAGSARGEAAGSALGEAAGNAAGSVGGEADAAAS